MRWHQQFALVLVALLGSSLNAQEPTKPPPRVLLLMGGPTREYQFALSFFGRHDVNKTLELALYPVPPACDLSVVALKHFPHLLQPTKQTKAEDKVSNLNSYDVVVAVDFDWTQVEPEALLLLQKWVERGGGLIFLAGKTQTPTLAKTQEHPEVLQPLLNLLPVVLDLSKTAPELPMSQEPVRLTFKEGAVASFLKLDAKGTTPLAGWDDFFTDGEKKGGMQTVRGFYNCFPVKALKKGAVALATFQVAGQKAQPWLATHTVGKGRVLWIGSLETWRLRQHSQGFYERFWLEMTHYAVAANRPR